ncbi:MAG: hypothetical protein H9W81_10090 [Enterococcus sp.]|nr:hypothetical protein [Enterococcus sp.]
MDSNDPEVLIGEIIEEDDFHKNFNSGSSSSSAPKPANDISDKLKTASANISGLKGMLGRFGVR